MQKVQLLSKRISKNDSVGEKGRPSDAQAAAWDAQNLKIMCRLTILDKNVFKLREQWREQQKRDVDRDDKRRSTTRILI